MFYQGSLQEGISTAVSQQKIVLCFVMNDNEESQTWENEFLQDNSLKGLIEGQSVALRLAAGSESAGYLSQIFPLPQTPTVVIMKYGELKEYIAAGATKEDFIRRIQTAFNVSAPAPAPAGEPTAAAAPQARPSSPSPSSASDAERSETVRRALAERAAKLEAQRTEAERKAQEQRAKDKGKAKAEAEAGADTHAARAHNQAELVRQRKQQEAEHRRRILKRIEDDRTERRLRAAEREQRRIEGQQIGDVAAALVNTPESTLPSTTRTGNMTSISVRLLDGMTTRSRFKTTAPFSDVRKWVDDNRTDSSPPYTLKQLLTPMPNKAIDATDDDKTLAELGLAPSSTLILVAVSNFASAYEAATTPSIWSRIMDAILGFLVWLLALVGLGGNRAPARRPDPAAASETHLKYYARIRRSRNQSDLRTEHQLYNGNSLNFEPQPDEDEAEV